MEKLNKLYEGKTKKIFQTKSLSEIIIEYKDDMTAFNGVKHDILKNKGIVCAEITKIIMEYLAKNGVATQFLREIDPSNHLCKKLKMISLEIILRNSATGSIIKNYPIPEGTKFNPPLIQFFLKNDQFNDPLITEKHIYAMKIIDAKQLDIVCDLTWKVNTLLLSLFNKIGINLIDFKLEFGFDDKNNIILGDEMSPDNMRIIDQITNKKLDKELYRQAIGDPIIGYNEVLRRLKQCLKK